LIGIANSNYARLTLPAIGGLRKKCSRNSKKMGRAQSTGISDLLGAASALVTLRPDEWILTHEVKWLRISGLVAQFFS